MIDTRCFRGFVLGWEVEGFEEKLSRSFLHLVFTPSIVETVIMIIPNWDNRDCFCKNRIVWLGIKVAILFFHYFRVIGVRVNIIAHKQEGLWLVGCNSFENAVITFRPVTRTTGNSSDWFLSKARKYYGEKEEFFHGVNQWIIWASQILRIDSKG